MNDQEKLDNLTKIVTELRANVRYGFRYMKEELKDMRDNHLKSVDKRLNTIENKITNQDTRFASQAPIMKILNKTIDVIITAVVFAIITLVLK